MFFWVEVSQTTTLAAEAKGDAVCMWLVWREISTRAETSNVCDRAREADMRASKAAIPNERPCLDRFIFSFLCSLRRDCVG